MLADTYDQLLERLKQKVCSFEASKDYTERSSLSTHFLQITKMRVPEVI